MWHCLDVMCILFIAWCPRRTMHNVRFVVGCRDGPSPATAYNMKAGAGCLPLMLLCAADELCDPADTDQTFVEELIRLPGCFLCYTPATGQSDTHLCLVFLPSQQQASAMHAHHLCYIQRRCWPAAGHCLASSHGRFGGSQFSN